MNSPILQRLFPHQAQTFSFLHGLAPSSHDSSLVGYHVTQSELTRNLDLAVQASWSARHSSKYVDVKVLLMSWEGDDLGVQDEVQVLESVFRDLYNYDVENWKIPNEDPGLEAASKVLEFVRSGRHPDNLLILYYAGHASQNPNGGLPAWVANRSPNSPNFDSSCVQPHFCHVTESSPDVLLLYDSCHPANGHGSIKSGRPVIELLAACGFESVAAEVGRDSFTNSLIQELSHAASQRRCISVPELHRRLICRLQSWNPSVLTGRDGNGRLKVVADDGIPVLETPRRRTPIHCQLSLNDRPRPIALSPLPSSKGGPEFIQLNSDPGSLTDTSGAGVGDPPELQVLIKVSIVEDKFNEAEFKEWLCGASPAARGIKILGVLPSCSTLLLLRIPIEVWDMLPPSPAISFIGFVWADMANEIKNDDPVISGTLSFSSKSHPETNEADCANEGSDGYRGTTGNPIDPVLTNRPSEKPLRPPKMVNFKQTDDQKSLVEVLNNIDDILPVVFRRIRQKPPSEDGKSEDVVFNDVIEELQGLGVSFSPSLANISLAKDVLSRVENGSFIRRYLSARHLIEFDNPVLDITSRLNLLIWHDYDAADPDARSASGAGRSDMSSLWSGVKTLDSASSIGPGYHAREAELHEGSVPLMKNQKPTANSVPPPDVPPPFENDDHISNLKHDHDERGDPNKHAKGKGVEVERGTLADDDSHSGHRYYDPFYPAPDPGPQGQTVSGYQWPSGPSNAHPSSFDTTTECPYLESDILASRMGESVVSTSGAYASDYEITEYPINQAPSFGQYNEVVADGVEQPEIETALRAEYKIEYPSRFAPGEVFRALWTEPRASSFPSDVESLGTDDISGQKFYVGFQRFIVVANDEGHCTCVPILTYERRGCTKKGTKPQTHGIIYKHGDRPRMLRNEPELGFPPVSIALDDPSERIAKESRVNYSKLITVEHNVKVSFIGRITRGDFEIVMDAVDSCWAKKMTSRRKSTASKKNDREKGKQRG